MREKPRCNRKTERRPDAPSASPAAPPRVTNHKSRVTKLFYKSRHSQITLLLIDIWRFETPVTHWKQTMRVRSNRHGRDTPLNAVFAARNVVSAPRRVLASPFSALGVPRTWRNPRVHREHPPGGGIGMLIPMHRSSLYGPRYFHAKCLPEKLRNSKVEGRQRYRRISSFEFSNFD
jgi:hypothetical protein